MILYKLLYKCENKKIKNILHTLFYIRNLFFYNCIVSALSNTFNKFKKKFNINLFAEFYLLYTY